MYYISILLIILANIFYHFFQKSTPNNINPIASLIVTYITALIGCIIILIFYPKDTNFIGSFKGLNWVSYALGFTIIFLELGFLLAYRAGWNISYGAVFCNVILTLLLIPIGILFFKEDISTINLIGIPLCIIGLIFITWK
ncbi:MAG: hypothetical protein ABF289_01880 [Clostridiales bacterium]